MRFYGLDYQALLKTPLSAFWEMAKNIRRIQAADDMRHFRMLGAMFSGGEEYAQSLRDELGTVAGEDNDGTGFDRRSMDQFRAKFLRHNL